ncbi:hypothetical protein [Mesorhizobium sp. M0296]
MREQRRNWRVTNEGIGVVALILFGIWLAAQIELAARAING